MKSHWYTVRLVAENGDTIIEDEIWTLAKAKDKAKYMLSDAWARDCDTTHERLGTCRVEIKAPFKGVIWDKFRN